HVPRRAGAARRARRLGRHLLDRPRRRAGRRRCDRRRSRLAADLPHQPADRRPLPGQALIVLALAGLSGGFILAGSLGWGAPATLGLLALGILAALAFWRVER